MPKSKLITELERELEDRDDRDDSRLQNTNQPRREPRYVQD